MKIYLLRHGIAENAKPGSPDEDRALTEEGRDKLRRVLARARNSGMKPAAILSSPYRRAIETAQVAAEMLGHAGPIERTRVLLPEASPYDVWEEIRQRKGEDSLLLASHEPLMSSLAAFLLGWPGLAVDMKKGALLRVDCDRFGVQPRCVLKWMLSPSLG